MKDVNWRQQTADVRLHWSHSYGRYAPNKTNSGNISYFFFKEVEAAKCLMTKRSCIYTWRQPEDHLMVADRALPRWQQRTRRRGGEKKAMMIVITMFYFKTVGVFIILRTIKSCFQLRGNPRQGNCNQFSWSKTSIWATFKMTHYPKFFLNKGRILALWVMYTT